MGRSDLLRDLERFKVFPFEQGVAFTDGDRQHSTLYYLDNDDFDEENGENKPISQVQLDGQILNVHHLADHGLLAVISVTEAEKGGLVNFIDLTMSIRKRPWFLYHRPWKSTYFPEKNELLVLYGKELEIVVIDALKMEPKKIIPV